MWSSSCSDPGSSKSELDPISAILPELPRILPRFSTRAGETRRRSFPSMRRFSEEPTPRRGRCVAPSREQKWRTKSSMNQEEATTCSSSRATGLSSFQTGQLEAKSSPEPSRSRSSRNHQSKKLTTLTGLRTNKEKNLLFILLHPLLRTRRDSCPRDPSPRSTTGGRELLTS